MKDYLQPAATFALALSIASLPFMLPLVSNAQITQNGGRYDPVHVTLTNPSSINCGGY